MAVAHLRVVVSDLHSQQATDSTLARGQDRQPIFEQENDEGPEDEQEAFEHPRLRQIIQRGHPINNILGSL